MFPCILRKPLEKLLIRKNGFSSYIVQDSVEIEWKIRIRKGWHIVSKDCQIHLNNTTPKFSIWINKGKYFINVGDAAFDNRRLMWLKIGPDSKLEQTDDFSVKSNHFV